MPDVGGTFFWWRERRDLLENRMEKQQLLNTYINNVTISQVLNEIASWIEHGRKSYIVPVNVDVVIKIEHSLYLKQIVDKADMVLADGKPLIWISKLYRRPVQEKISGSDLVPLLCRLSADRGYTVFILGGEDGIAEQAGNKLKSQYPGIKIAGTYAPPFGFEKDKEKIKKVNQIISHVQPDLLIACLGCPKQEKFVYENYLKYNAKVSVCAGATVDFLAGKVKRAPKWMREHGLEWFYRFLQEPKRMFQRYFIDDMKIIKLIWKYK